MMLDRAKRLLTPSGRSNVPPFMVMDVMAAAARIEAAGGRVVHMEVGQPAAPAPRTAIAAARMRRSKRAGSATPRRSAFRRCARASRGTMAKSTASTVDPGRVVVTTGSSAGFILAFLALFEAGDRVAVAIPGYPPYRHILSALGCEPVLIETSAQTRWEISGEALLAAHRARRSRACWWQARPIRPAR